jgi:ATP-binding cassette subfamily F protein 3
MAGLLLGPYNVLVLDEPGNHLDVETVDALAQSLLEYEGTVVFTSHDRSFMKTVATNVVEVKDGRVTNYLGDYGQYLASVTREIDDAEAADEKRRPPAAARRPGPSAPAVQRKNVRTEREVRKEIANLERTIAKLDAEKRERNQALLQATDPAEALRLHTELTAVTEKLAAAEERWLAVQEELSGVETA